MTLTPMGQRFRAVLLTIVMMGLTACDTISYYSQAASGQLSLILDRQRIDRLLARDDLEPEIRRKLQLVVEARGFAEQQLMLPVGSSYRSYVELERPYVLWNVFAAPEFSTTPTTWCYPVAGCVAYRGFFSEQAAQRFADRLQYDGFDVYTGGVDAYSTLGWFEDPLTSSVLNRADHRLVSLLFHELSHRLVYLPGDTTFNESFATFVEQEGLRRWLREHPQVGAEAMLAKEAQMQAEFVTLVTRHRDAVAEVYAAEDSSELKRQRKSQQQEALRRDYEILREEWGYRGYDRWFAGPLNNAQLATVGSYNDLVPEFAALLQSVDGDLGAFYERVEELTRLPAGQRAAALQGVREDFPDYGFANYPGAAL